MKLAALNVFIYEAEWIYDVEQTHIFIKPVLIKLRNALK